MPANLPPQFFSLQEKLKKAENLKEKISILEEMLAVCPKHKGTEKVRLEIKKKIAKLKKETKTKKAFKKESIFTFKKEGAGQVVIVGPPNSGKTTLLNSFCNLNFKVADFPFTTSLPQMAMADYENIKIQIIDTPPLTKELIPGWLKSLLKSCDLILAIFDASDENFKSAVDEFENIFKELNIEKEKIIFVANKIDALCKINIPFYFEKISALNKLGLKNLKDKIFEKLKIVRVYTKTPGEKPDFSNPFVLKKGSKISNLTERIGEKLSQNFKFAKLWKKSSKHAIVVGKDYILEDEDIVEIH